MLKNKFLQIFALIVAILFAVISTLPMFLLQWLY